MMKNKVSIAKLKKAIRKRCLDCSAFQPKEVQLCPDEKCPLWEYRNVR